MNSKLNFHNLNKLNLVIDESDREVILLAIVSLFD